MTELSFELIGENNWRLVVKKDGAYLTVVERYDEREEYVAKLSLFGLSSCRHVASLDPKELDRFLFL